ncbi:hypothetical protein GIB67_020825 [Kingdonia uniflora]|uniref:Uncharacterized protein n=1 Tax=Kingdonia uniflora TaxID=39325 RepID=A0A7J7M7B7_9MAGN|nr:hypothetical protein GIB67_020825 [Kingdonia uniflora]
MSLPLSFSPFAFSPAYLPPKHAPSLHLACTKYIVVSTQAQDLNADSVVTRRSANYQPSCWDYDFMISRKTTDYTGETHGKRVELLKESVRGLLNKSKETVSQFTLIDDIQRLGLGYHFEKEIKKELNYLSINKTDWRFMMFYLADVFKRFEDEMSGFKAGLCEDAKDNTSNSYLADKINQSMEVPLHWMLPRLDTRRYIDEYEKEASVSHDLLELAKLDYNMVQTIHQKEVGKLASWWVDLGLHKLSFVRDRLVEHYFWSLGMVSEPHFDSVREAVTKVTSFVSTIDDIYDIYGSLEELELFTDAVVSWDINAMEQLPEYMKMCFLALYNTNNEISYEILKQQSFDITPYQKKAWADICTAFLVEAKWYYEGYTPTLDEFLNNSVISIGAPTMLLTAYLLSTRRITREALECIENYPSLIRCSAMLVRLSNDLGTSRDELERGDVSKSIQCYMKEKGVSEEVAREHIQYLIGETWKKMNKELIGHHLLPQAFVNATINLARIALCLYQYGDGYGVNANRETKAHLKTLLVDPVPMKLILPSYGSSRR